MEDFCLPDLFVWFPEAQYPAMYPDARPVCKWHGTTECVQMDGWMRNPRHVYESHRVIALIGKRYNCTMRQREGVNPFGFRGIDRLAIEKSNDYVQMQWARNGFDVSHHAAI